MHGSTRGVVALTALAGAIGALILTPVGSAGPLRAMGTPATYADPTGDAKSAPDVVSISVDLDAVSGGLRFDIGFANAEQLANGGVVAIALDSDRNSATGDRAGSDYLAAVF